MKSFPTQAGPRAIVGAALVILALAVAVPIAWKRPTREPSGSSTAPSTDNGAPSTTPASGPRIFRFYQEAPTTLDPALAADAYSSTVIAQIYSPLVGLTSNLEPTPQVADSWTISRDGAGVLRFGDVEVRPPLRGEHNLRNAMLAIATARSLGISVEDAAAGIARTPVLPMRSAWVEIGRFTVINDAYNANPASARESLRMLGAMDTTRQRVAVLGSMLELGAAGPALHDEIAQLALRGPAQIIAGVGEFARALQAAAPNDPRIVTGSDAPELWPVLVKRLAPDAVILLKGSRGTRLERLIPLIETASKG